MTGNTQGALALDRSFSESFSFENHQLRIVIRDGEPWFVAVDVCAALGIVNSRDALSKLDDDEKGVGLTDTLGGNQTVAIVSESGLYTLILRCRDAVNPGTVPYRFRKWVTSEVLPAIRKTGRYEAPAAPAPEYLSNEQRHALTYLVGRMAVCFYRELASCAACVYTHRKECDDFLPSGIRTRQTCGFFTPRLHGYGRECADTRRRKAEEAHRLGTVITLPPATRRCVMTAPRGLQDSPRSAS